MIAASSFIDSDFKTEDVKAKCNKAVLNPPFFCSNSIVIKTNNKITNKNQCKVIDGEILLKKRQKWWVNVDGCKIFRCSHTWS